MDHLLVLNGSNSDGWLSFTLDNSSRFSWQILLHPVAQGPAFPPATQKKHANVFFGQLYSIHSHFVLFSAAVTSFQFSWGPVARLRGAPSIGPWLLMVNWKSHWKSQSINQPPVVSGIQKKKNMIYVQITYINTNVRACQNIHVCAYVYIYMYIYIYIECIYIYIYVYVYIYRERDQNLC